MLQHTHYPHPYPLSHYDNQMCLKAPMLLWVTILYLSRAITLPIAMGIGHAAGVDNMAIEKFHEFWSAYGLIPSLMAALVLITLIRRVPAAPDWMRWVFARGRIFLAAAAISDIALLWTVSIRHGAVENLALWSIVSTALDAAFLAYILASRRVRHVFAEFPLSLT